ncbi:hypothetical protein B5X24_HaOG205438 [Helicoverpa armigera]|nr:hypothetical protein B5X24_HaOG205438 [Helicoverpa armigera]
MIVTMLLKAWLLLLLACAFAASLGEAKRVVHRHRRPSPRHPVILVNKMPQVKVAKRVLMSPRRHKH